MVVSLMLDFFFMERALSHLTPGALAQATTDMRFQVDNRNLPLTLAGGF